jgi:uncharacterized protein (TIGR03435 family)
MRTLALALLLPAAWAQNPNAPRFEVASIRPSASAIDDWQRIGVHIDGAMVRVAQYSLRDYIALAYRTKAAQISAPAWLAEAKFDIAAKLPDGAPRSQVPEMMQTLLEERFRLVLHHESKEMPVYVLSRGSGALKLKESAPDPDAPAASNVDVTVQGDKSGRGAVVNLGPGSTITNAGGKIEGRRVTIAQMLSSVERYLDRPLVDQTGLTGVYDITIEYSLEELRNVLRSTGAEKYNHIPDSAADQFPGSIPASFAALGLKFEARKAPLDVIVIDHMEKAPAEN